MISVSESEKGSKALTVLRSSGKVWGGERTSNSFLPDTLLSSLVSPAPGVILGIGRLRAWDSSSPTTDSQLLSICCDLFMVGIVKANVRSILLMIVFLPPALASLATAGTPTKFAWSFSFGGRSSFPSWLTKRVTAVYSYCADGASPGFWLRGFKRSGGPSLLLTETNYLFNKQILFYNKLSTIYIFSLIYCTFDSDRK